MNNAPLPLPILRKLAYLPWMFLAVISLIAGLGILTLQSIQLNNVAIYADQQLIRYLIALAALITFVMVPPSIWMRLSYPLFALAIVLVLLVPLIGVSPPGAGAKRWLMVFGVSLQPSELLKITLVLALARYFHFVPANKISHPLYLIAPAVMILAPLLPIFLQPDLGTTMIVAMIGAGMIFLAGVNSLYFITAIITFISALPILWANLLPYQRERVFTYLDPEKDPLGAGYHILQSKIAIGSADMWGKGVMQGTQSQLNFLPKKHTDFIFAMFTEERGFMGAAGLMGLYMVCFGMLSLMALRTKNLYGRLVISGMALTMFLYVFINMGMVMGMLPVVGVPLPLMSYGGSSIASIMFGLGIAISTYVHRSNKA
ncbi:MAG: rod shape-determining protein RodA [bacterium]|nr:rod shape-determining protein RodA [bacterium]